MKTSFSFFFLFYALLFLQNAQSDATSATCSCPEQRVNQISASSFGMTLLSPSFSSRYLNLSHPHGIVIKDPTEPIWFASTQYYWDQEYYKWNGENANASGVCTYRISYYNRELRKVKYANGDRPTNITFRCNWYQECCDLGCCTSGAVQVVIYVLLYSGVVLMIMGFCAQLPSEYEDDRRLQRARLEAGPFLPCQRPTPPVETEEQALREIVNQEASPKYDDLYPTPTTTSN